MPFLKNLGAIIFCQKYPIKTTKTKKKKIQSEEWILQLNKDKITHPMDRPS